MLLLLAVHALAALAAPFLVRALGRRAFSLLALPSAATFGWALAMTPRVTGGTSADTEHLSWVPQLGMTLSFRLDSLSWLLCLVVGGVGALVLLYCTAYFDEGDDRLGRFASNLTAFAGSMFGLVTTDNLMVLYVFWEATTVLSYLLIGHVAESIVSRAAAMQALVITTTGGLAMLAGIVLIGQDAGTYEISALLADPPTVPDALLGTAVALVLLGAVTKSALVPVHFWLPGAMAAPTPVSAYLHAAAMVKAGIYLIARLAPAYALVPTWRPIVLTLGAATMLIGAYRALRQRDLKLLLAYGTVSQLGLLTILVGVGTVDGALAGVTLLLAHALFKGALFLVVGAIDHATGTRDIRRLSGLWRTWPALFWTSVLAAGSMAGLPAMLGFVSKEGAYTALTDRPLLLAVVVTGSALTVAYSYRFVWGAFGTDPDPAVEPTPVHRTPRPLTWVPASLALVSLVLGPLSPLIEPILHPYAATLQRVGPASVDAPVHLGLWHGVTQALWLTLVTFALGLVLVRWRRQVETVQAAVPLMPEAESAYRAGMHGLDRGALATTGALQPGSLPQQLGVILGVFVTAAAVTVPGALHPRELTWWEQPAQGAAALVIVVAAVAAVRARRRLRAVFLVGVTGYGTAVLFLLHGAPDLALTQVLVETLALVLFVLVIRRLPGRFNDNVKGPVRAVRWGLGIAVGVATAGAAIAAAAARQEPPTGQGVLKSAETYGGGTNIVNIILVDTRAWDTMGEISVVLAAATGVASLVFLRDSAFTPYGHDWRWRRRFTRAQGTTGWLVGGRYLDQRRRSMLLEVVTRLIFHTIVLWSLYLIFSGHSLPGGGFAAGLVAGLALTMRYLSGARAELRAAAPLQPGLLLGGGLAIATGSALLPMLVGGAPLQSAVVDLQVPILGKVHLVTSLAFDVGVYLVVVGLVLDILRSLGSRVDTQIEQDESPDALDPLGRFGSLPASEEAPS